MRLNKMRLAAAMMSAVMAASTMSTATFAEDLIVDEEIVSVVSEGVAIDEIVEDQEELAGEPVKKEIKDIKYCPDGSDDTVVVTYSDTQQVTLKGTKVQLTNATCTQKAWFAWSVVVDGTEYTSVKIEKDGTITGRWHEGELVAHNYVTVETILGSSDCTTGGSKEVKEVCSMCKAEKADSKHTVNFGPTGHKLGAEKVEYVNPVNINIPANGSEPTQYDLADPTLDGSYGVRTYQLCSVCNAKVQVGDIVTKHIAATNVSVASVVGRVEEPAKSNIRDSATTGTGLINNVPLANLPKDEEIRLVDCTKDGTYWIDYRDANGKTLYSVKHTVPAHHWKSTVSFEPKTAEDRVILKPLFENGKQVGFTNVSCYKNATYYRIEQCGSQWAPDKCPNSTVEGAIKTEITVEPAGDHVANADALEAYEDALKDAKAHNDCLTKEGYAELKKAAEAKDSGIKLNTTATCTAEGTVSVTFFCAACNAEMNTTDSMKVEALGHDWDDEKLVDPDSIVKPTCTKDGSFDIVQYCKVCNAKNVVRAGVIDPATGHNFEKENWGIKFKGDVVVDKLFDRHPYYDYYVIAEAFKNGEEFDILEKIGYAGYSVFADLYLVCDTCGDEVYLEDLLKEADLNEDQDPFANVVEIVDLKKGSNGEAGTITLNATCKIPLNERGKYKTVTTGDVTFPYYGSVLEYLDRNPSKAFEGLHLDSDGIFRYYEKGVFKEDFTGLVPYGGYTFYVENGLLSEKAGLTLIGDKFYYLAAGARVATEYTGLVIYDDHFFYVTNGVYDTSVTGLIPYNGSKFLFIEGRLVNEKSGLWQYEKIICEDGDDEWYFLAYGEVQNYTGKTSYDGAEFTLVDGKLVG